MSDALNSCLYVGWVSHARLRPFRHRFFYRHYSMLLDLAELPKLDTQLAGFGYNRRAFFSFWEKDHGARDGGHLASWVEQTARDFGCDIAGGKILLLCLPRVFGYQFNPLSVYFCHDAAGALRAVLHQVHNTFGDSHCYFLPVAHGDRVIMQRCAKKFHVSPFFPIEGGYRFRLTRPDDTISILIRYGIGGNEMMVASQQGQRQPLTRFALWRAFAAMPFVTLKTIAAIHYQALKLWLKGARYHPRPTPPIQSVSADVYVD